jgi:YidC/Oxa1 family membrane protein insertase
MDQKRLIAAIAISIGILLTFEVWNKSHAPTPPAVTAQAPAASSTPAAVPAPSTPAGPAAAPSGTEASAAAPATPARVITVNNGRVEGRLSARGLVLEQLTLTDYRETIEPNSPLVTLLAPRGTPDGYFAQWGWSAGDGRTRVPDADTDWTAQGGPLSPSTPVTLSWDNGQGQVFQIVLTLDANFMVQADQRVGTTAPRPLRSCPGSASAARRTPHLAGFYILHEGFIGVLGRPPAPRRPTRRRRSAWPANAVAWRWSRRPAVAGPASPTSTG